MISIFIIREIEILLFKRNEKSYSKKVNFDSWLGSHFKTNNQSHSFAFSTWWRHRHVRHELQASHASANFRFLNMNHLSILCKNLENSLKKFALLISSNYASCKIIRDFNTRNIFFLCSWVSSPNSLKAKKKQKQQSSGSNHHDGVADRPPFTSCQHAW